MSHTHANETKNVSPSKTSSRIGLRNLIIHEYLEIDYEQIYRIIQEDLEDLTTFAEHVEKFLEANPDA
jgi:uncharacterized protein YutE (UPF0331/DUF86 family)